MNFNDWLSHAAAALNHHNFEGFREARLLAAFVLKQSYEDLFFAPPTLISAQEAALLDTLLNRRLTHEPLAKILGFKEFWGHRFKVTHDTLDPRPETETLIEGVLMLFPDKDAPLRFLDLGTGTGCLPISLLLEYQNATAVGVDLSPKALEVAKENCRIYQLEDRLTLIDSNWFENVTGTFEVIISNPPYISPTEELPEAVSQFDPPLALYAENNGLAAYEAILREAGNYLAPNGHIFLEIGYQQRETVSELLKSNNFDVNQALKDLNGHTRVLIASISKV